MYVFVFIFKVTFSRVKFLKKVSGLPLHRKAAAAAAIWYHIISYDIIWYYNISYDFIWCDMISYDIIGYDIIWYVMISHDIIWYEFMLYDIIWYYMTWFDKLRYTFWTCSGHVPKKFGGSKMKFFQKVLRTFGLCFGIIRGV